MIDVNDIVGNTYGSLRVVEYMYTDMHGGKRTPFYKVECTKCGNVTVRSRYSIKSKASQQVVGCLKCCESKKKSMRYASKFVDMEAMRKMGKDTWQEKLEKKYYSIKPQSTNVSTGIKHYSIQRLKSGAYRHKVQIKVGDVIYILFDCARKEMPEHPAKEVIAIVDEMNNVLSMGGSEAFVKWYEENFKKNRNNC